MIMHAYFNRMDLNRENVFYAGRVVTLDGKDCALVWIERRLLDEFTRSIHILMDGTFTIPPRMFYQLVTIHFIAFAHVAIDQNFRHNKQYFEF